VGEHTIHSCMTGMDSPFTGAGVSSTLSQGRNWKRVFSGFQ